MDAEFVRERITQLLPQKEVSEYSVTADNIPATFLRNSPTYKKW